MAPSQELELNVQFNQCCVLLYVIEFSLSVSHAWQAAYLFSEAWWLCCAIWEVTCCCDVSDLVSFANLIPCLLLWLTQNELRRCKDSRQGAAEEQLDCGVTCAETVYVEIGFLCRDLPVGVHTNQHRSRYLCPYTSLILFNCAKLLALIAAEVKIAPTNYLCVEKLLCHLLISVNNPFFFLNPSSRLMVISSHPGLFVLVLYSSVFSAICSSCLSHS